MRKEMKRAIPLRRLVRPPVEQQRGEASLAAASSFPGQAKSGARAIIDDSPGESERYLQGGKFMRRSFTRTALSARDVY